MPSSAEKHLIEKIDCTALEAQDLLKLAKFLANLFKDLARHYSSDHIPSSYSYLEACRQHAQKDKLGRLLRGNPELPYGPKLMWETYKKVETAEINFNSANSMHSTGIMGDRCLTICLECLDEARELLGNATQIVEGRRVFESLSSERPLYNQLNI